ncbi:hypothetical protein J1N35_007814 [Gossypium stocksii]|uniref:Uncharacterized protein n=1 Tax=Gossypium stocksii TaxID=47602 RepID=A0A9D4AG09_9ROSI|nr:hypothetical protein J1N35_007814 [Gossypium stocksii]
MGRSIQKDTKYCFDPEIERTLKKGGFAPNEKELLSNENDGDDDEAEADKPGPTTYTATEEKNQKGSEGDEKKTESMSIESDQEREEVNHIPAPTEPTIAPQSIVPISKQYRKINQLIDALTKLDDNDEEEMPINMLKRK